MRFVKNTYFIVVLFILCEIGMRVFFTPKYIDNDFYIKYTPDYNYGFDDKPLFYREGNEYVIWRSQYYKPREDKLQVKKQKNEYRIFMFGDSVSFSPHKNATISYYLEDILNSSLRKSSINFNVVNFSYPDMFCKRMLSYFERSLAYEPDLAIVKPSWGIPVGDKFKLFQEAQRFPNNYIFKSQLVCLFNKIFKDFVPTKAKKSSLTKFKDKILNSWKYHMINSSGKFSQDLMNEMKKDIFNLIRRPASNNRNRSNDKKNEIISVVPTECGTNHVCEKIFLETYRLDSMKQLQILNMYTSRRPEKTTPLNRSLFVPELLQGLIDLADCYEHQFPNVSAFDTIGSLINNIQHFDSVYDYFSDTLHLTPMAHIVIAHDLAHTISHKLGLDSKLDIPSTGPLLQKYNLHKLSSFQSRGHVSLIFGLVAELSSTEDEEKMRWLKKHVGVLKENKIFPRWRNQLEGDKENLNKAFGHWLDFIDSWIDDVFMRKSRDLN